MPINMPCDDLDVDNLGGFDEVLAGWVHGKIVAVDEDSGDKGDLAIDIEVLRHTSSNQVGKVHRELFRKTMSSKFCRQKFIALALAASLTTTDELKKMSAEGKVPSIDYTKALGKQICIKLTDNEYNGKTRSQMDFDRVFHPTHKKANDCPINTTELAAARISLPVGRNPDGAVSSSAKPSTKADVKASPKQAANVSELMEDM